MGLDVDLRFPQTPPETPVYVYDSETIRGRARQLRAHLASIDTFFYALKANNNEGILRVIESEGEWKRGKRACWL